MEAVAPRLASRYLVIAVFGGLVLIVNPRVADDYRNYYIDRTWSCFPRLISHFYPLGEPLSFVKDRPGYERDSVRWCGFMPAKADGIKSFGEYGILKLKFVIPDEPLLFTFSSWANTTSAKPALQRHHQDQRRALGTITFRTQSASTARSSFHRPLPNPPPMASSRSVSRFRASARLAATPSP
jgi:hypothetical protein